MLGGEFSKISNFSVQWYDIHTMDFIFYDDKILLLFFMFRRRKIKPWDPRILGNDIFTKEETTFGSL